MGDLALGVEDELGGAGGEHHVGAPVELEGVVVPVAEGAAEEGGGFELEGELVLLPLRSDLGDIDRILGGLVLDGQIGRTPRRIEIVSETRQSLVGFAGSAHQSEPLEMPQKLERSKERAKQRLRESIAKTKTAPEANLDRSHLRLVVNND